MQRLGTWVLAFGLGLAAGSPLAADDSTPQKLAADRLRQLARLAIDGGGGEAAALDVARMLLEEATAMAPEDPELWRLRIEAAKAAGEVARVGELLRSYLAAAPGDDAAQLRFAESLVAEVQTAPERAAAYERMVQGSRSGPLSDALRSRLAWRAAALHRGRGDDHAFRQTLRRALELDATNAPAAAAAYHLIASDDRTDRLDRARALLMWHTSDPANPQVHLRVGRLLLGSGQYEPAAAWFDSADLLAAHRGGLTPEEGWPLAVDWALSLWGAGQPHQAAELIGSVAQHGDGVDLPVELQAVLALIYSGLGQEPQAAEAFARLEAMLREHSEGDPDGLANRAWLHLLCNRSIEAVEPWVEQLRGSADEGDVRLARIRGWRLLRLGRTREALQVFGEVADRDPAAALGLALATEDPDAQARQLAAVWSREPGGVVGVLAAEHLRRLGVEPQSDETSRTIAGMVRQVPDDLRLIGSSAARFLALRLTAPQTRLRYAEPVRIVVQLTNLSEVPLSVGPEGVAPTTVFLIPKVNKGDGRWTSLSPQVVDLDRALVLNPGRSIEVRTHLDAPDLIRLLDANPGNTIEISVTAILNPREGQDGKLIPGLLGSRVVSRRIERSAAKPVEAEISAAIDRLGSNPADAMPAAAWLARIAADLPAEREDLAGRVAAALTEFLEQAEPPQRAWAVSFLVPGDATRRRLSRLIGTALRDPEAAVRFALLAALADRSDAPELTALLRAPEHSSVRRFAGSMRSILRARADAREQEPAASVEK